MKAHKGEVALQDFLYAFILPIVGGCLLGALVRQYRNGWLFLLAFIVGIAAVLGLETAIFAFLRRPEPLKLPKRRHGTCSTTGCKDAFFTRIRRNGIKDQLYRCKCGAYYRFTDDGQWVAVREDGSLNIQNVLDRTSVTLAPNDKVKEQSPAPHEEAE
jgi:hypothetical protein